MRTGRPRAELVLTAEERIDLERWARRPKSSQALAQRSRDYSGVREGQEQQCRGRGTANHKADGGQVAIAVSSAETGRSAG